MRFHILLSLLLSIVTPWSYGATAQSAGSASLAELLPLIPSCALQCILQGFSQMPNALSDPVASCSNAPLQASISACVQAACSFTDQARLAGVNQRLCAGVPEDRSRVNALIIVSCTFGFTAIIAIALRTFARQFITKHMGSDDWTMFASGVILAAVIGLNFFNMFGNGFGKHYWNLDIKRVTPLLKIFYASEIVYIVEITLIKVSILLFYLRLFPGYWFRFATSTTMALVIVSAIAVLFPIFFQCSPVRGAWDRTISAKCININLLTYAAGGIAVGLDIIILLLPIPDLVKLNMSRRKKCHVLFMFSLGSVACITSIVRLKYLGDFANSTDPTWDNTIGIMVSIMEICVAMICACLPALRAFFCHFFPHIFGRETTTNAEDYEARYPSRKHKNTSSNNHKNHSHNLSSTGPKPLFSTSTSAGSRDRAAYGLFTPTTTKGIDSHRANSPNLRSDIINDKDETWFGNDARGVITHDQEFVQDIEQDAMPTPPLRHDGVSRPQTVTTKIWVDHGTENVTSSQVASPMQRLRTRTMERRDAKMRDGRSGYPDSMARSLSAGSSIDGLGGVRGIESRNGSEDSIFVLQGVEAVESHDERKRGGDANGRRETGGDEIELHAFDNRWR